MLLKRFYDEALAQASYLVACQATGEALVVDPNRDADFYAAEAAAEDVRITHVTETHIHADFASGSRELAARTGAALLLSDEGGPDWRYGFAASAGATLLHDGDAFQVGNVRVQVLHTPGHTPEHVSFLVTDGAHTAEPMGILSGDFLFVGDVGRPDLLEKAAGMRGTMEEGARRLFRSLQRLRELPDHLQVWPGHGAGSACGKALGAVPTSTLGYERRVSWAFAHEDEAAFVGAVLADQPEPPRYFAVMKALNRDGPPVLGHLPQPERLEPGDLERVLDEGGVVADLRSRSEFGRAHARRTLHLPFNRSFTTWAGWLLPYDCPVHLIADGEQQARSAARALALIGLDRVAGYFEPEAVRRNGSTDTAPAVDVHQARRMQEGGALVVDVRGTSEWRAGHPTGAVHVHLGSLEQHADDLPASAEPVVLICRSGNRSAIAQSLLQARGRRAVNVEGGIVAWERAGLPVSRSSADHGEGGTLGAAGS
jgi:hydroxyacylglutathione hydrolase